MRSLRGLTEHSMFREAQEAEAWEVLGEFGEAGQG